MKLCIIVPAYNAVRHLGAVVGRIEAARPVETLEVVVVDDGSTDGTGALAKDLASSRPWLSVISRPVNGGYGAAMKDGLAHARRVGADRAASVHADGQYGPEVLSSLLGALEARRLDLVQGSRIAGGGALAGGMPLYKYAGNWALNKLERAVFALPLSDFHSGYLVYGARALAEIPFERLGDSFDFDMEVIAAARARGLGVGEGPIPTHYGDEISHLNPLTYGLRVLRVMWRFKRGVYGMLGLMAVVGCATGSSFPWPAHGGDKAQPASRADVVTVNAGYQRETSQVLVRKVTRPSRASLDYAAYDANFMNADPPPEGAAAAAGGKPDASHAFAGKVALGSMTGSIESTPLTADERAHALALPPLVELMVSKHIAGADRLEDAVAAVRAESWGLPGGPQIVRQTAALGYLHDAGAGRPVELWIKIEFAPWFHGFSGMPDDDGDGFPDVYGQIDGAALGDPTALVAFIRTEYEGRVLTPTEVKGWAHQLASYWYPSYNTDLVPTAGTWPASDTEPAIRQELGSLTFPSPTVVMRGKPEGKPVYNIFLVEFGDAPASGATAGASPSAALTLAKTAPSPAPKPVAEAVKAELAAHGGSWSAWAAEVAPLSAALKARVASMPAGSKAFAGADGFLFFKQSVAYATGGDVGKQKHDRNPLPVIAAFRKLLAHHGVDLLFVPVPTKVEIYPEKAASTPNKDAGLGRFGGKVVNPFGRKFLLDLAAEGVEAVDLMPAFLAGRGDGLYQAQDTHWTSHGLELAAKLVADRIHRYPWYKELAAHRRAYQVKDAPFTRHGDLHSRLPEADKARYQPETLVGHQVIAPGGEPYDDDPDSPVVLLGDSFTGVYELMDCEHAGVSAHIAREIGYPLDLVMSYGGGPNVRQKLLRRGEAALGSKKLVIWMMTARDLHDFGEGWLPLGKEK